MSAARHVAFRDLQVGDTVPSGEVRSVLGEAMAPVWLAVIVPPRRDFRSRDFLRGQGLMAFAPARTRVRHYRGVRSEIDVPMVPGIVYARFDRTPQWDVLRERSIISGVLARGGVPVVLRPDDVTQLRGLPEAMAALVARAETVSVGEIVRLTRGPLAGYLVEVTEVRGLDAVCEALGIRVIVPVADVVDGR